MVVFVCCREHREILQTRGVENLDQLHREKFPNGFYNKIYHLRQTGSLEVHEQLISLANGSSTRVASYPGCVVNGVRFLCYDRDKNRKTQNSGVSVAGVENNTYYGQLEEVLVMSYLSGCSVVLFKCKWFDTDPTKSRMKHENNITSIFTKFECTKMTS